LPLRISRVFDETRRDDADGLLRPGRLHYRLY
jgi:hypothetical protein